MAWRRWRSGSLYAFPRRDIDDATGRGAGRRTDRCVDGVGSLQNASRPLASVPLCCLYTGSGGRALRISSGAGAGNAGMTVSWEKLTAISPRRCHRPPPPAAAACLQRRWLPQHAAAARRSGSWRGAARQGAAWPGGVGGVTGAPQGFRGPRSGPSEKLGGNSSRRGRHRTTVRSGVTDAGVTVWRALRGGAAWSPARPSARARLSQWRTGGSWSRTICAIVGARMPCAAARRMRGARVRTRTAFVVRYQAWSASIGAGLKGFRHGCATETCLARATRVDLHQQAMTPSSML